MKRTVAALSGVAVLGAFALLARANIMDALQKPVATTRVINNGDNVRAPDFPANFKWFNTAPLSLRGLRGKVVLLDFWTYGCINCIHVMPDLKKLERKYPNELVVIGVHSAKFAHESKPESIREAVLRFKIEHPVLVDQNMRVWDSYAARAWPTFVVISPDGRVVGQVAGEGHYATLDATIQKLINDGGKRGNLSREPLKLTLEAAKAPRGALSFPAKVLADPEGKRLFVADSGHNRILVCDTDGRVTAAIGTGAQGSRDGAFDEATFNNPHGMALKRDGESQTLYVADTDNHLIRALDLTRGTVSTVAGIGKQAGWGATGGAVSRAAIASPWDLLLQPDGLIIAMAGPHQIWKLDFGAKRIAPYAGTGAENRKDGTFQTAGFAQPSGLTSDGANIFVADAETSTVRALNASKNTVRTLAGGDLFDFGDRDGRGDNARLQHPLAVAYDQNRVFVADAYNHKIKVLNPQTGDVTTFAGAGKGTRDGDATAAQFNEPGGLSVANGRLYIADTNNGTIRVLDLESRRVSTLKLSDVPTPLPNEPERAPAPKDDIVTLPEVKIAPGQSSFVLDVALPKGHKLSEGAPQKLFARVEGAGATLAKNSVSSDAFALPVKLPLQAAQNGRGAVVANATVFYCSDTDKVCRVKSVRLRVPFSVSDNGATELRAKTKID